MSGLALRLSVTDRCDLRCLYCAPAGARRLFPEDELLTFEEMDDAVRVLMRSGVTKVRLTGGEPLVRRGIEDLLAHLGRNRELTWTVTTNGQRLARVVPALVRAGFARVNISLDSLDPEKFRMLTGGGKLERTLRGSEAAEASGLAPVKWNVVAMRDLNIDEAATFAAVTLERPIHIRFIEYMPSRGDEAGWRRRYVPATEILERIREVFELRPCIGEPCSPARLYRIPGALGRVGVIAPISAPFCRDCNRLRLSSNGMLYACLSRSEGLDLRALLRDGFSEDEIEAEVRALIERKRILPERIAPAHSMASLGG